MPALTLGVHAAFVERTVEISLMCGGEGGWRWSLPSDQVGVVLATCRGV